MPLYRPPLPEIDPGEIKRYAGLKNSDFDPALIEEAATEILILAQPKTSYQIYGYDPENHRVLSDPPFELKGNIIARHLQKAKKTCLIAATIGNAPENAVSQYFKEGRYAYSVILDAAATCLVEAAADALQKEIARLAATEGLRLRWRFSPGYGDWDLAAQPRLVELSQAASLGINLTKSLMLEPRKSITAIIGMIGEDCESGLKPDCRDCDKTDCQMRK